MSILSNFRFYSLFGKNDWYFLVRDTTATPLTKNEILTALFHGTMGGIIAVSDGSMSSKDAILDMTLGLTSALITDHGMGFGVCGVFVYLRGKTNLTALMMGLLSGNLKEGPSLLGGLLGAATILSSGGGPITAVLGGAFASAMVKKSTGLLWKIQRVASRSL